MGEYPHFSVVVNVATSPDEQVEMARFVVHADRIDRSGDVKYDPCILPAMCDIAAALAGKNHSKFHAQEEI